MSTEKVQHEYGADEIQILEGLEAVRKIMGVEFQWVSIINQVFRR